MVLQLASSFVGSVRALHCLDNTGKTYGKLHCQLGCRLECKDRDGLSTAKILLKCRGVQGIPVL